VRSVFAKEWLQGHMIALFGLLLGGLIVALWGILTVAWVKDASDQGVVNAFCGILYLIVPLILATFVGSGLIAAEAERGTLPLLLGLPFTRRQVWLGKVLAGLALLLSAVVLVIVPGAIAAPSALQEVTFWELLPDLAVAALLLFCGALLFSSLSLSIINAFLGALGLSAALVIALIAFTYLAGARLTPYGPLIDIELWALASCPALLAGSYVGFTRGELFRGRRRWLLPTAAALLVFALTSIPIIGAVRYATRYQRSAVDLLGYATLTGNGSALSFSTCQPPLFRWRPSRDPDNEYDRSRPRHIVLLDTDTGDEILVRRGARTAALSPDRKLAAVLTDPPALTWQSEVGLRKYLEIWDIPRHRLLYRGCPETSAVLDLPIDTFHRRTLTYNDVEWSPDSQWLAVYNRFGSAPQFLVMDPEGSTLQPLATDSMIQESWGWSPDSDVYYLDADVRVIRHSPAQNAGHLVCDPRDFPAFPDGTTPDVGSLTVSPDGRFITVSILARENRSAERYRSDEDTRVDQIVSFLLHADGSHPQLIYQDPLGVSTRIHNPGFFWSPDARHLYFLDPRSRDRVFHWSAADEALSRVRLPVPLSRGYITALPDSSGMLLWEEDQTWTLDNQGHIEPLPPDLTRSLHTSSIVGFDAQGRAIFPRANETGYSLVALDLHTGDITHIYP